MLAQSQTVAARHREAMAVPKAAVGKDGLTNTTETSLTITELLDADHAGTGSK